MKYNVERYKMACILVFTALVLTGCATQPAPSGTGLPGFWMGLAHGFLIFFSMIGSLFTEIRIYAFPNSGNFYDLGYLVGAMLSLGGTGVSVR